MSDTGDILPFVSLPLIFLGPEGVVAYFAINMAGCATAEDPPPQTNRDDAGVEYDSIDADFVEEDSSRADELDDADFEGDAVEYGEDAEHDVYMEDSPAHACHPGDFRTCGPCNLGTEVCEITYTWSGKCEGADEEDLERPHPCYSGPEWTQDIGICRGGERFCNFDDETASWSWGTCVNEVVPQYEICDSLDNDCDYSTDEDTMEDCGGCACIEGACEEPVCAGESSCGDENGCGDICQSCPPGEICTGDSYCAPLPLECVVTDSFDFGVDFTTHGYVSSAGVHPGISPGDSCGAALGVYFDRVGDWVQISLAVDPASDIIKLDSFSNTGGVTIQADGFGCHEISCWTGNMCRRESLSWHMHELSYNIASDGIVDFVFRAGSVVVGRTDIAIVEALSCSYVYP